MDKKDAKLMEHVWKLEIDGKCAGVGWEIHGKLLANDQEWK